MLAEDERITPEIKTTLFTFLVLICLTGMVVSGMAQDSSIYSSREILGKVAKANIEPPDFSEMTPSEGIVWRNVLYHPSSDFLILHFVFYSIKQNNSSRWSLQMRGKNQIITIESTDLEKAQLPFEMWTDEISGNRTILELYGDPRGLRFKVDKYIYSVPPFQVKNIIGNDDRKDIINYRGMDPYEWGKGIALLKIIEKDGYYPCTAFLLSDDLLLTNEHCLSSRWEKIIAEFNYETGNLGRTKKVGAEPVMPPDYNLDFVILRLKEKIDKPRVKPAFGTKTITLGEPLIVIQHPAGQQKQVVIKDCRVDHIPLANYFCHTCDTLSGSSGSPVFNVDGIIVGVHQWGFNESEANGVNKAVRAKKILEEIGRSYQSLLTEIGSHNK